MKRPALAAAAALALAGCGRGDDQPTAAEQKIVPGEPITNTEAALVPSAANAIEYASLVAGSDLYEVESSRLALERSEDADVRGLAETIVADHERSTRQLREAAADQQPPVPVEPRLNADQQRELEALRAAGRGAGFDREYVMQQVSAHERALGMLLGYAETGDNEAMRRHAAAVAEPVRQHLERARALAERMQRP